jgi:hypothetical protein
MKKTIFLIAMVLVNGTVAAQTNQQQPQRDLSYTYAEVRFVDADNDGDGFRLNGSVELNGPWILVGGFTSLDFDGDVETSLLELGAGYVFNYTADFDLFGTLRIARAEVDTPFGDDDETGFAFSAGTRGMLTRQFEIRGSVNHINLDNSDTYLELAGDYYFTDQLAAGLSLEFAGDTDVFTIGARWFFR